jgi:hypothetical protein
VWSENRFTLTEAGDQDGGDKLEPKADPAPLAACRRVLRSGDQRKARLVLRLTVPEKDPIEENRQKDQQKGGEQRTGERQRDIGSEAFPVAGRTLSRGRAALAEKGGHRAGDGTDRRHPLPEARHDAVRVEIELWPEQHQTG